MTVSVADRVRETSSVVGTNPITLEGTLTGFQSFSQAFNPGDRTYYAVTDNVNWEIGVGTLISGSPHWSLSRDTVLSSSNFGSIVDFPAGTKDVWCDAPAETLQLGPGSGTGSVTSVTVAPTNGFAGSIANQGTTPAITLSTTVSGMLKGAGGALSVATSGVDFAPATTGTSIVGGNGSGGFVGISVSSDLTFSGGIIGMSSSSTATNLSGGYVNATNVAVNGLLTIDSYAVMTSNSTTTTSVSPIVLVSLATATDRSAEISIQGVDSAGGKYHYVKILIVQNGSTVGYTEYGAVNLGGLTSTFTAAINGGNMQLIATPTSTSSTTFKTVVTAIKV